MVECDCTTDSMGLAGLKTLLSKVTLPHWIIAG